MGADSSSSLRLIHGDASESGLRHLPNRQLRGRHALALHEITLRDGLFVPTAHEGHGLFDPYAYSLFKYGHGVLADDYGRRIGQLLLSHLEPVRGTGEEVVVVGTPYKRVPNAARWLAVSAQHDIRIAGIPAAYATVYQQHLSVGDYGRLTAEEREARNRQKRRVFDPEEFQGRHVVVVDDIRITGSITASVAEMFGDVPVLSLTFAFLVIMDPGVTETDPQVEDRLNHYAISDLSDLHRLMTETDSFSMTTRAVKFVLESKPAAISRLLRALDAGHLRSLYYGALDDGYDRMPRYAETFRLVSEAYEATVRIHRKRNDVPSLLGGNQSRRRRYKPSQLLAKFGL